MASNSAQKLKVLHLMNILRTETDPRHGLTMPQIIDRFGRGVDAVSPDGGRTSTVTVRVRENPSLYGWLAALGDGAEVLHPKALREGYADWLGRILGKYETK